MAQKEKKFAGRVPVETLKEWGFNVESIQRNDEIWNDLESGRKTKQLLRFSIKLNNMDKEVPVVCRVHLYEDKDGKVIPFLHTVRASIDASNYKGHDFTKAEAEELFKKGQIRKPVLLQIGNNTKPCLVGVDRETKEIIHVPVENIHVKNNLLGAEIKEDQIAIIKNGGLIVVEGMVKNGVPLEPIAIRFDLNKDVNWGALSFTKATPELLQEARRDLEEYHQESKGTKQIVDISPDIRNKMLEAIDNNQAKKEKNNKNKGRGI